MPAEPAILSLSPAEGAAGTRPAVAEFRRQLRRQGIAAREALSAAAWEACNTALLGHLRELLASLGVLRLGFCWPIRREPDVRAGVADWLAQDPQRQAALPIVPADPAALTFHHWWPEAPLALDRYGIPYPQGTPSLQPQALLIPLNAFDERGFRIGYGGGYFDRTLAALTPRPLAIGVAFELARVGDTCPQPHDLPMDWLVTEQGVWATGPASPVRIDRS